MDDIWNRLKKILIMIKPIPDKYVENNFDKMLTGKEFNYDDIDCVYLLLEIKKEFNVDFTDKEVSDNNFLKIGNICSLIYSKAYL